MYVCLLDSHVYTKPTRIPFCNPSHINYQLTAKRLFKSRVHINYISKEFLYKFKEKPGR